MTAAEDVARRGAGVGCLECHAVEEARVIDVVSDVLPPVVLVTAEVEDLTSRHQCRVHCEHVAGRGCHVIVHHDARDSCLPVRAREGWPCRWRETYGAVGRASVQKARACGHSQTFEGHHAALVSKLPPTPGAGGGETDRTIFPAFQKAWTGDVAKALQRDDAIALVSHSPAGAGE